MSDHDASMPPGEGWQPEDWQRFGAALRRAAKTLDGDPALVARVRARLDRELESGGAPVEPILAGWPVWRARLGRSVLLRLVAASVLLHVLALPVLAYLWWRPQRPPLELGFLPVVLEPTPAPPEPDLRPQPLPEALDLPAPELDPIEALETRLRLDRFRRAQLEPAPAPGETPAPEPLQPELPELPELTELTELAARRLGLSERLPEGRSPNLAWARWSLAVQLDLDAYADGARLWPERDGPAWEALSARIQAALAQRPTEAALLSPAERAWCDDVAQRAIDFGLLPGHPDERGFPGDPRRWIANARSYLPEGAAERAPWRKWLAWASGL
jgi:hypothetical protein